MDWNKFTAALDCYSVMFALGTAIYSPGKLRKGSNGYEIAQNAKIQKGNKVWWTLFWLAAASAASSLTIKMFVI